MAAEIIYTALERETTIEVTRLSSGKYHFLIAGPYGAESIDLGETQMRALRHVVNGEDFGREK